MCDTRLLAVFGRAQHSSCQQQGKPAVGAHLKQHVQLACSGIVQRHAEQLARGACLPQSILQVMSRVKRSSLRG